MRYVMIRIFARFYQRKASYLKSIGDEGGAALAANRSELLFRKLQARCVR